MQQYFLQNLCSKADSHATCKSARKIGLRYLLKNKNLCDSNRAIRLTFLCLVTSLLLSYAQHSYAKEAIIRATMLYQIANFIEWHPDVDTNKQLEMCIIGKLDKKFLNALKRANKASRNQNLLIREAVDIDEITQCNIVLVSNNAAQYAKTILKKLAKMPILTVGETAEFVELGGMVDISVKRMNNFQPLIHLDRIYCSGIQISSRILKVSKRLIGKRDKSQINCDEIILEIILK